MSTGFKSITREQALHANRVAEEALKAMRDIVASAPIEIRKHVALKIDYQISASLGLLGLPPREITQMQKTFFFDCEHNWVAFDEQIKTGCKICTECNAFKQEQIEVK